MLSEYTGYDRRVLIEHKTCSHRYTVTPNNFFNGKRCPACNQSKGERLIEKILSEANVEYRREYRFSDCKLRRELKFDFVLFRNSSAVLAIEYDGMQHFRPMGVWGGEEKLKRTQECDKIKDNYCKSKNIPLVRIPYTMTDDEIRSVISVVI